MADLKIKNGSPVIRNGKAGYIKITKGKKYFVTQDSEGNPILELLTNADVIEVINTIFEALRVFERLFNVRIPISLNAGTDKYGLSISWIESQDFQSKEFYFRCLVSYQKQGDVLFSVIDDKEKAARKKMKKLLKENNIK